MTARWGLVELGHGWVCTAGFVEGGAAGGPVSGPRGWVLLPIGEPKCKFTLGVGPRVLVWTAGLGASCGSCEQPSPPP